MTRKGFLGRLAGAIFGAGTTAGSGVAQGAPEPQPAPPPEALARRAMIEELARSARPDELARKARSEAILRAAGVPVLDGLPVIAGESRSLRRESRPVAERLLGAMIASVKAETNDYDLGQSLLDQYEARPYLTPAEQAFMDDPDPDQQTITDTAWRYEGVLVLFWALGLYDALPPGDQIADVGDMGAMLSVMGPEGLFDLAVLRPQAELLDMADYYYRLHWAVTDARLKGQALPGGDASIVLERARALNWLYGYGGQSWDEVSADT
ncbi:MAG: DUF4272 domain-containing protein [Paracoccus sp. (in: a-proteobacteria)]|nr:DUF4272 domain-containing protein [Paracoccus sp. (in: a-proteobacteria)]